MMETVFQPTSTPLASAGDPASMPASEGAPHAPPVAQPPPFAGGPSERALGGGAQQKQIANTSNPSAPSATLASLLEARQAGKEPKLQQMYLRVESETKGADPRLVGGRAVDTPYGLCKVVMPAVVVKGATGTLRSIQTVQINPPSRPPPSPRATLHDTPPTTHDISSAATRPSRSRRSPHVFPPRRAHSGWVCRLPRRRL